MAAVNPEDTSRGRATAPAAHCVCVSRLRFIEMGRSAGTRGPFRSILNTARAHHNRAPSRQKGHTLKGRSGGLGAELEGSTLHVRSSFVVPEYM